MPQNMQKRPAKVVSLDLEEVIQPAKSSVPANEDEFYQQALEVLRRGLDQKAMTHHLIGQGLSHHEASQLAGKVWKENQHTRRQNSYILFGFAGVLLVIGTVILISQIRASASLSLSSAYLFFVSAAWFGYKGYSAYRHTQ